jgi:formamidopyrimidine-DNA glycosylase
MPELPEVETFKRYLDITSLRRRITKVEVCDEYVLKRVSARTLARQLNGCRFENSYRHGKHLFVRASRELWLRLHFGMTGSFEYLERTDVAPKTARVIFHFADNCRLAFDDQRKFGEIELIEDVDEFLQRRGLGADALRMSLSKFEAVIGKRRGAIKVILLNQQLIAGIGNLYADEILFRARMHPGTDAAGLSGKHLTTLFHAMRYVLEKTIALKTNFKRLPKSWLLPHREKHGKCPRCGRELKSATIGGRTSRFCTHCQKRIGLTGRLSRVSP